MDFAEPLAAWLAGSGLGYGHLVIVVGTSGWQYEHWRGRFYPAGLAQRRWLEHYAESFATVEVNNAFYRLPERTTFADWRRRTPAGFLIAVKMSRYLTHIRRLRDPAEPVARFLGRASALAEKLGPVLVQLPPTLPLDLPNLAAVLEAFAGKARVVVEARHRSWFTDEVRDMLARHGGALCWADRRGRAVAPLWRTADFGYLRMHEGIARPRPHYGPRALESWLDRIEARFGRGDGPGAPDVFVYFNNDSAGAAVANAIALAEAARSRGLPVTRTPAGSPRGRPLLAG